MKKLLIALLFFPASAFPITFAQLAVGGGYEASIMIANKSTRQWNGFLQCYQGKRLAWVGAISINTPGLPLQPNGKFAVFVPANGMIVYRITGDKTTRSGFLEVLADTNTASRDDDVAISYFYRYSDGNGKLISSTGSGPSQFHIHFTLPVEKTPLVNTGIAWAPSDFGANQNFLITLVLLDLNGEVRQFAQISYDGQRAAFFDQLLAGVGEVFSGSLYIDAGMQIYVEALRLEQTEGGFLLTSTPPNLCLARPSIMP